MTQVLVRLPGGRQVQVLMPNEGRHELWPNGADVRVCLPATALRALPVERTQTEQAAAAVSS